MAGNQSARGGSASLSLRELRRTHSDLDDTTLEGGDFWRVNSADSKYRGGQERIHQSSSGPLLTSPTAKDDRSSVERVRSSGRAEKQQEDKGGRSTRRRASFGKMARQSSSHEGSSPTHFRTSRSPPVGPRDDPHVALPTAQVRGRIEKPRQILSEVQLTKNFLKKEIEARSQKISVAQLRFISPGLRADRPHKVFIVSAKLPFTIILDDDTGKIVGKESDPFDTNILDLLGDSPVKAVLVGAPVVRKSSDRSTVVISEEIQETLDRYLREECKVVPVFPSPGRDHFADWMIWPLFHYQLPSAETGVGAYDWEGYQLLNQTFCQAVLNSYTPGDLVWINDYQLMLLPKLIRTVQRDAPIGFYLHCVFPSGEVYRILPQREDLLRGVLSSNIIGFHNFQYAQHFLTSCIHVLGLECTATGIEACEDAGGTYTKVVTVPLGINLNPYRGLMAKSATQACLKQIEETFGKKKILVAIDNLQETKGIRHKLMAFHKFLTKSPDWASECVLVQIVEELRDTPDHPSEHDESDRNKLLQQLYEMVGGVNSKFGRIGHLPVHFLCQDVSRTDTFALMSKAHVMIDTPLRDMLTRSAHEFLCCQEEEKCGVLILSEFSGSTQSLRAAALCVNPWDTNQFSDAIQEALEMEHPERLELHRYGRKYVHECTLQTWAANFLEELQTAESECETERLQIPPHLEHEQLVSAFRKSTRRIVVLGFIGTLLPRQTRKTRPKVSKTLLGNMQVLAEDPNTDLIVVSSSTRDTLNYTLGKVPCWIIAEGGVCWREPGSDTWRTTVKEGEADWLGPVKEIMEYFTARTPGSTVIEMPSSVSWNYQKTQGDHAAIQSKDLLIHLWSGPLQTAPAEVVVDVDSVTVRPSGVGKALQLDKLLHQICNEEGTSERKPEWFGGDALVVSIGDFLMRDEDMYATLQKFFEADRVDNRMDLNAARAPSRAELCVENHRQVSPAWEDNLEANSKSLGTGLSQYKSLQQYESELGGDVHPFGLHKAAESSMAETPPMLKKTPSEPDLQMSDLDEHINWVTGEASSCTDPVIYTCTVSRKATRAAWHLCDTNDVAFLIAQMARELRQAKQAEQAAE